MSIERWGNPPDPAFAVAEFGLLFRCILMQPIRRICDNRMERVVFLLRDPVEAIRMMENRPANTDRLSPRLVGRESSLYPSPACRAHGVEASSRPHEQAGRVQAQIKSNRGGGGDSDYLAHPFFDLLDLKRTWRQGHHLRNGIPITSRRTSYLLLIHAARE